MKKLVITFCLIFTTIVTVESTYAADRLQDDIEFYSQSAFSDIKTSHPSFTAIQWGYHNAIISGDKGKFSPSNTVTEAHFAKMYAEFFAFPAVANENPKSKIWSDPYYTRLSSYGAPIKGAHNNAIRNKTINRGTVAQLIAFAHGQPTDLTNAVNYMMKSGISTGQNMKETNPVKRYGASNTLTRAQAITFLYRMYQNNQGNLAKSITPTKPSTTTPTTPPPASSQPTDKQSYAIGGSVIAEERNSTMAGYELAFVVNGKQIGGYLTKKGLTFEGFTIGQAYTGKTSTTVNNKSVSLLVDKLDGNKLKAIYWTESSAHDHITKMKADQSKLMNLEVLMMNLTNISRVEIGRAMLTYDTKVAKVAKAHSSDMRKKNYFSHTNLEGLSPFDRMGRAGLVYRAAGENIAMGYETIFHAHNGFINSKGHRENILKADFKEIGIGIDSTYYTVNFITY